MVVLFAIRMAKLSRLAGGDEPRRGGEGLTPTGTQHRTHLWTKRVGKRGKSFLCMGNPSGPTATSPTRQRSFASGGTNSSLRWISNPTRPTLYDLCVPTLIFRCPAFLMKPMGCLCAPFWMGAKSDNVIRFHLYILFYIRLRR